VEPAATAFDTHRWPSSTPISKLPGQDSNLEKQDQNLL
jgi:hypothetical protein